MSEDAITARPPSPLKVAEALIEAAQSRRLREVAAAANVFVEALVGEQLPSAVTCRLAYAAGGFHPLLNDALDQALAVQMPDAEVETDIWEDDPEHEGCKRRVGQRNLREVFRDIQAIVGDCPPGCNEYFMVSSSLGYDELWPRGRVIVWPSTGGSEGHYTHVGVIDEDDGTLHWLITGKTFDGWDAAWAFGKRLAKILGV